MGRVGLPEIIIILLIIIILFGAKKLPEIGAAIGKALREFKKAGKDAENDANEILKEKSDEKNG